MAAETGSGKTGAFSLPVVQIVWETLKDLQDGKLGNKPGGPGGTEQGWRMSFNDRGPVIAITPSNYNIAKKSIYTL